MKTAKILLIGVLVLWTISCEKDSMVPIESTSLKFRKFPKTKIPPKKQPLPKDKGVPGDAISLKFQLETAEDQMGRFYGNAMVVFDDKVWSVGGFNSYSEDRESNEIWASENGKNWYSMATAPFRPRTRSKLVVFRDKMWLFGGEYRDTSTGTTMVLGDVWNSEDGITWVEVTPPRTTRFAFDSGNPIVFNDRLFYINPRNTISTADGVNWGPIRWLPFTSRYGSATVVFDHELYVIGGELPGWTPTNAIWKSNDGINWTQVMTVSPLFSARSLHTSTVYENKVWVIGGLDAGSAPSADLWYSSDMIIWHKYDDPMPFEAYTDHNNLVFNGSLWHFGGWRGSGPTGEIWSIKEE